MTSISYTNKRMDESWLFNDSQEVRITLGNTLKCEDKFLYIFYQLIPKMAPETSLKWKKNENCTTRKSTYFIPNALVYDTDFLFIRHTRNSFCKTFESRICQDNLNKIPAKVCRHVCILPFLVSDFHCFYA